MPWCMKHTPNVKYEGQCHVCNPPKSVQAQATVGLPSSPPKFPKTPNFPLPSSKPLTQSSYSGLSLSDSQSSSQPTSPKQTPLSLSSLSLTPSLGESHKGGNGSATTTVGPVLTQWTASKVTRGTLLGTGSYKSAYNIEEDSGKVLIVIGESKKRDLAHEADMLQTLRQAGVRVPEIFGGVDDLGNNEVGLLMEKMAGKEVKERDMGMTKSKLIFLEAAKGFGFKPIIDQLQAVVDYVKLKKGIIDCQFFVGVAKGCVLFDPAALGASTSNDGLTQMIKYLDAERLKPASK